MRDRNGKKSSFNSVEGEMEMAWRDQDYALTDLVAEGVKEGEMERA